MLAEALPNAGPGGVYPGSSVSGSASR